MTLWGGNQKATYEHHAWIKGINGRTVYRSIREEHGRSRIPDVNAGEADVTGVGRVWGCWARPDGQGCVCGQWQLSRDEAQPLKRGVG
jgi:hypothetical protein